MIEINNVEVFGWEAAIRGMRNPMNSWDKSDSGVCATHGPAHCIDCEYTKNDMIMCEGWEKDIDTRFTIGDNDLKLIKNLVAAGSDHSKFMRMINVTLDITAPLYWWKEFDTYKVGTVRNSCSTMHKIHEKKFTMEDFSYEHLILEDNPIFYKFGEDYFTAKALFNATIDVLNGVRIDYLKTKDKKYWWQMIQLLPSSYNQKATVQLNYAVLRNMYHSRKNHKLDEWVTFCKWIETLPYSELITMKNTKDEKKEESAMTPEELGLLTRVIEEFDSNADILNDANCGELSEQKRQVADWLKELKRLKVGKE